MKVLIIGPRSTMKGGISTVINGYKTCESFWKKNNMYHYSTCIDGFFFKKLLFMVLKILVFPFFFFLFNPDIIHIHTAFGNSFVRKSFYVKFCHFFKKKIILHVHGAEWENFYVNQSQKKRLKIQKVFKKCGVIIALSDEWKMRLANVVNKNKIVVIPNFVSIYEKDVCKKEHQKTNITFVGEICNRKGTFNIPDIISKVKSPEIVVSVAGYGEVNRFLELVKNKKLSNKIKYVGFVDYDKKISLLSKTDIFLFPSFNEGVPMVLLEAMAFGIPCVTTNVGGIHSIINPLFKTGNLYSPEDFIGLANEINHLMTDYRYYDMISKNSKKVAEKFSLSNHLKIVDNIYQQLRRS